MKKILSLILVLAIGSVASAGTTWLEVDASDAADAYAGSSTITINLVSDIDVLNIRLALGTDNGGTLSSPSLHSNLSVLPNTGTILNSGGILVYGIGGSVGNAIPPTTVVAAGEAIYSFEFHVPELPDSTYITIDDFTGVVPGAIPPVAEVTEIGGWDMEAGVTMSDVTSLTIHIPEPATICLLGIGALSLIRRRKTA